MVKFDSIEEKVIFEKLCSDGNKIANDMSSTNVDIKSINENISALDNVKNNVAFRPIFSHRPILGNCIIFVKRVIRKCVKFYVEPICFQQTEFNNISTNVHKQMLALVNNIANKQTQYEDKITALTEKQGSYEEELAILTKKQGSYEDKLAILTKKQKNYDDILEILKNDINKSEGNGNNISTSQAGEDRICAYVLRGLGFEPAQCSYLDLGANHAKEISNTYYFYSQGARGVLVEANPDLIPELQFYRKDDIIINKCLAPKSGDKIKFYIMNGDRVSSCDENSLKEAMKINPALKIIKEIEIETIAVNDIIAEYFSNAPIIMNIDIEGQEMNILKSIDFEKYRPIVLICEMIDYSTKVQYGNKNETIMDFMLQHDYIEYAFTGINSIFIDKRKKE